MLQDYIVSELRKFSVNIGLVKKPKRLRQNKTIKQNIPSTTPRNYILNSPKFCNISVNEECFFRCKMCFKWKPDIFIPKDAKRTTTEDIKNFLKGLRTMVEPGFLINFAGGETLLRKDMFEIIRYAANLGFETNLASNGFLIDKEMARRMVDSGLGSINFSLDASNAKLHDYIRGKPGSFVKLMQSIKNLTEYMEEKKIGKMQFRIAAQAVVSALNLDDIPNLIKFVDGHPDILSIKFNVVMQPNNTIYDPYWYKGEYSYLWPKDTKLIDKVFDEILRLKKEGSKVPDKIFQIEAYRNFLLDPMRFVKTGMCNFDKSINLSSTGDMFLCFNYANIGNIKNTTFEESWNSTMAENTRKEILACQQNCHFLVNCNLEE